MSLPEFPPVTPHRIRTDTDFLIRQLSALERVKWKQRTWNECGEKVFRDFVQSSPTVHLRASRGSVNVEALVVGTSMDQGTGHLGQIIWCSLACEPGDTAHAYRPSRFKVFRTRYTDFPCDS